MSDQLKVVGATLLGAAAGVFLAGGFAAAGALSGALQFGALGYSIGQGLTSDPTILPDRTNIEELSIQKVDYGAQVPRLFGRPRAGGVVVWLKNNKFDTVKSTVVVQEGSLFSSDVKQEVSTVFATFAIYLGDGPLLKVNKIYADDELVFDSNSYTSSSILAGASSTYFNSMRVYKNASGNIVDDLMESALTRSGPAYRRGSLVVFENFNVTKFGNRLPTFTYTTSGRDEINFKDIDDFDRVQFTAIEPEYAYPPSRVIPNDGDGIAAIRVQESGWVKIQKRNDQEDRISIYRVQVSDDSKVFDERLVTLGPPHPSIPEAINGSTARYFPANRILGLLSYTTNSGTPYVRYAEIGDDPSFTSYNRIRFGFTNEAWAVNRKLQTAKPMLVSSANKAIIGVTDTFSEVGGVRDGWVGLVAFRQAHSSIPYEFPVLENKDYDYIAVGLSSYTGRVFAATATDVYEVQITGATWDNWTSTMTVINSWSLPSSCDFCQLYACELEDKTYLTYTSSGTLTLVRLDDATATLLDTYTDISFPEGCRVGTFNERAPSPNTAVFTNYNLPWYSGSGSTLGVRLRIGDPLLGDSATDASVIAGLREAPTLITLKRTIELIMGENPYLSKQDVDLSGLTTEALGGYARVKRARTSAVLEPLVQGFQFDVVEEDYQLKFKSRSSRTVRATIAATEIQAHEVGQEMPDTIIHSIDPDHEVPARVEVIYSNPGRNYEKSTEDAVREDTFNEGTAELSLPLIIDENKAAKIAHTILSNAEQEARGNYQIVTGIKYSWLVENDLITVVTPNRTYESLRITAIDKGKPGIVKIEAVNGDVDVYNSPATGYTGQSNLQSLVPISDSEMVFMDTIPLRDGIDQFIGGYMIAYPEVQEWAWGGAVISSSQDTERWNTHGSIFDEPAIGLGVDALKESVGEQYWGFVSSFLSFDEDVDFEDQISGDVWTDSAAGGATPPEISFAEGVYGNSLRINSESVLQNLSTPTVDLGTGDFTIEFWMKFDSVTGNNQTLVGTTGAAGSFKAYLSTTGKLGFRSLPSVYEYGSALTPNTWYHIAFVRSAGTLTPYIDGVAQASNTVSQTMVVPLKLGEATLADTFAGYIDDWRVTKGFARYTAAFTPAELVSGPLTNANIYSFDYSQSLTVAVRSGAFTSASKSAVRLGVNTCIYGVNGRWEIIKFVTATDNGDGTTTLSGLIRGYYGTEQYLDHEVGDLVCLVEAETIQRLNLTDTGLLGAYWYFQATTIGKTFSTKNWDKNSTPGASWTTLEGEALTPRAPYRIKGTREIAGDRYWSNVIALLRMDNPAGTSVTDVTGRVWGGSKTISTSVFKFGPGSLVNGFPVSVAPFPTFGLSDYTVECWFNLDTFAGHDRYLVSNHNISFNNNWALLVTPEGRLKARQGPNTHVSAAGLITTGVWYHAALVRDSGTLRLFLEGVEVYSTPGTNDNLTQSLQTTIGYWISGSGNWDGYIDEVRVTQGVARYTTAFTPTGPFPAIEVDGEENDLTISWNSQDLSGRTWGANNWELKTSTRNFEVDILDNTGAVVRTLTASGKYGTYTVIYTAAQQVADFGSVQLSVDVNIYEIDATVGRGLKGEGRGL